MESGGWGPVSWKNMLLPYQGRSFLPSRRELACSVKMLIPVNHSTFQKDQMLGDICPWSFRFYFSSPKCPDLLWGPPSVLFNGYWGSLSWVKWPGHDVGLSPPSRTKGESEWSCISVVHVCLHNVDQCGEERIYIYFSIFVINTWVNLIEITWWFPNFTGP